MIICGPSTLEFTSDQDHELPAVNRDLHHLLKQDLLHHFLDAAGKFAL
jgi:hypothetical protein